ncbi:hypothetical protein BCR33DRAFT_723911 [Rhizoclosmatium globosum]|uniref:T6SS Phospholipase effector Tle1-like catalytic domain-containing protein n=1 Tax=Rhizoclosmatium globosum TaxID=329046 RepID=A0A1Y2B9N6_9FUNG|nr:hypothetical protein BCR33DRAFT_723911 [Rhizoclosmatium globosum]|eukprot:ORY31558.1 hypothetical protein BCR33DRAFT_723911 [Rhizoclosmatium globosum]
MNGNSTAEPRSSRKLIICIDGTSQSPGTASDVQSLGPFKATAAMTPSNITKLAFLANNPSAPDQRVYYHSGPGTQSSDPIKAVLDSMFGNIKFNVYDAYAWLVREYQLGDEIYGFGFSRGAAIVRALFSIIGKQGLLDVRDFTNDDLTDDLLIRYITELLEEKETRLLVHRDVSVKFIGLFDTVIALGVPASLDNVILPEVLKAFDVLESSEYDFNIGTKVQFAYHALSIDEKREFFAPTLFESSWLPQDHTREQVWFQGDHGDIGGGWWQLGLSMITLKWMIEKAESAGLQFRDFKYFESTLQPFLLGVHPNQLQQREKCLIHDYFHRVKPEDSFFGKEIPRQAKDYVAGKHATVFPSTFHTSIELKMELENSDDIPIDVGSETDTEGDLEDKCVASASLRNI